MNWVFVLVWLVGVPAGAVLGAWAAVRRPSRGGRHGR